MCVPFYNWLMALVPSAMVDEASARFFTFDVGGGKLWNRRCKRSTAADEPGEHHDDALLMTADMTRDRFGRYWMAAAVSIAGTITAVAGLWTQTNVDRVNLWQVTHVPNSVLACFGIMAMRRAFEPRVACHGMVVAECPSCIVCVLPDQTRTRVDVGRFAGAAKSWRSL